MRIGGLCFGYGGLDMAAQTVIGGELVWYSEIDKGANKIAAHRFPDVPNLGDMTRIDWAHVPPVDVLTGGTPCQDLSKAGKRAGMSEGTRSNLWVAMREAIAVLRPSLVIWENVEGAASAPADSEMEPCPGCVGERPGVSLRALGRVVGDLSTLGYVGRVGSLRAADVGAPHERRRRFLVAYPAGHSHISGLERRRSRVGSAGERVTGQASDQPSRAVTLLPTPAVNDMGEGKTPDVWDEWTATMQAKHRNGNGHGKSLAIETQRLHQDWGVYAAAITRWETLTRPAPSPTQPSKKGTPQLSPRFSEWIMGLPDGWVTDVPGITRAEALKALGNGVCPQQGAAALRSLLDTT
jgi:DNA (cytosine-5)-methyltransferase 1